MTTAIEYCAASPADETVLAAMLRDAPMAGWVRMQLLREPNYFAADALQGNAVTILARCGSEPVGLCRLQRLPVWINGQQVEAGYLAGLRVLPRYRHRLSILRDGFVALRTLGLPGVSQPICFTSMATENAPARRILEAGLAHMPIYRPLANMHTLAFATRQGRPGQGLRQATLADIPALAAFHQAQAAGWQFAPYLAEHWLASLGNAQALTIEDFWLHEENGQLRACVALWDQRRLKQTVAHSYRAPLNAMRGAYNCIARLTGRICLPTPGEALNQAYLAFFASSLNTTASLALLREALWRLRKRGIAVGVLGLAASAPLRDALLHAMPATVYETCIESVCFAGDPVIELDARIPQPEVALL